MNERVSAENSTGVSLLRAVSTRFRSFFPVFVLVIIISSIALVYPFFASGQRPAGNDGKIMLLNTHDLGMHVPQAMDLDKSLRAGVLYPRWLSNVNNGYGNATMLFYPPVFFYLLAFFNALVGDWAIAALIITALSFILSALAFYKLSQEFYGKLASATGAFFYLIFPYHLLDLYVRGAVPEIMGFALLPVVIYFAFKLDKQSGPWRLAGLSVFYSLYLMTNMPVGYLLTYTLAFYAVIRTITERDWRIAIRIGIAMGIGLLLSAIYWLPAALETKHTYEWATDLLPYHKTYITLLQGNNLFEVMLNEAFAILGAVIALAIAIMQLSKPRDHSSLPAEDKSPAIRVTHVWIVMAIFALFMSSSFSRYISMLIPRIQISTPAWRWFVIASMFTGLVLAASVDRLKFTKAAPLWKPLALSAPVLALLVGLVWYNARYTIGEALANGSYDPKLEFVNSGFIPKNATQPQDLPDTPRIVVTPREATILSVVWEPEYRKVELNVTQPSEVRLKTYNFPGWTARIDDQPAPLLSDKDGVQIVKIPSGVHKIEATFKSTRPRILGGAITGVGFLCVLGLTIAGQISRRRQRRHNEIHRAGEQVEELRKDDKTKPATPAFFRKKTIIIAGVAVVVAIAAIALIASRSDRAGQPGSSTNKPARKALSAGSEVNLYVEGLEAIPMATDERALDEILGAMASKDKGKIDELNASGRVINIAKDTRALILETWMGKIKVRVAEGQQAAKEGWVLERWIR